MMFEPDADSDSDPDEIIELCIQIIFFLRPSRLTPAAERLTLIA